MIRVDPKVYEHHRNRLDVKKRGMENIIKKRLSDAVDCLCEYDGAHVRLHSALSAFEDINAQLISKRPLPSVPHLCCAGKGDLDVWFNTHVERITPALNKTIPTLNFKKHAVFVSRFEKAVRPPRTCISMSCVCIYAYSCFVLCWSCFRCSKSKQG